MIGLKLFLFRVLRSLGWQWGGKWHGADVRLSTYVYCHCSESRPEEWWGCRWCSPQAFQGGMCILIRPMTVPCVHACVCVCVHVRVEHPHLRHRSCELAVSPSFTKLVFISKAWRFRNISIQLYRLCLVWAFNLKIDFHWIQAWLLMMSKEDVDIVRTYSQHNATFLDWSSWDVECYSVSLTITCVAQALLPS